MTRTAEVDGFQLTVPVGWSIWKYDDSVFQRRQFNSFAGGSKAVDAVALSDTGELWLIEIKDYRRQRRSKPSTVFDEVASKVRSTLAGLATARVRAHDPTERDFAHQCMRSIGMRIVLQLIQSKNPSRLFPELVAPQDAELQLRRALKAVDPRALCSTRQIDDPRLLWRTTPITTAGSIL